MNATRHAERKGEPDAPAGDLAVPPDYLTESQAEIWRYCVANAPLNVLRAIDRDVLRIWVDAADRHAMAMKQQAKLDALNPVKLLTRSKAGELRQSPYLRILVQSAEIMLRAGEQLGFSPSSRPRLAGAGGGSQPEPESPWARLQQLQLVQGGAA